MNFNSNIADSLQGSLENVLDLVSSYIPNLLGAIAILVIGWLIALLVSSLIGGIIRRTPLDKMLADSLGESNEGAAAKRIKSLVFYLIILFVLVAFFQTLGLTLITEPLNEMLSQIFAFAPRLLGGSVLLIVAWLIATIVKSILSKLLSASKIDERLTDKTDSKKPIALSNSLSEMAYWFIFLLMLPSVLDTLGFQNILEPVNGMFSEFLGFLPNILSSVIILAVGWFFAKILRKSVSNLLVSLGADSLIAKLGLSKILDKSQLSEVIGLTVYVLVLFPVLIAALDALAIESIVAPATSMLQSIVSTIPLLFAALIVIIIAYVVGNLTSTLVSNLLASIGFDNIISWLGVSNIDTKKVAENQKPSSIIGKLVLVAVLLFASMEAFDLLGFENISGLVEQFIIFASQVILGVAILTIGVILANIASDAIRTTASAQSAILAAIAKTAILILAGAMGLQQMGLASEIINLAFGILFGAIAVAIALAFGLGCKDIASREVDKVITNLKK